MEQLWSQAGATGGNQSQMAPLQATLSLLGVLVATENPPGVSAARVKGLIGENRL